MHTTHTALISMTKTALACERFPECQVSGCRLPAVRGVFGVQVVTPQELSRLHHALQQEAACMAVMLSNACMVHKLVSKSETDAAAYHLAAKVRHTAAAVVAAS